ncbi:MAG: hypothetical protein IKE46_00450 [Selenomonadaceae bacterium]|nr:hypothetical protein [Selenomonadaceae bacterium]
MMKFLSLVALAIFGTVLMIYAVVEHEPPAFIAYAFGILTGLCWSGLVGLYWLRQKLADNGEFERSNRHE